ncbi:MAG: hypothetical protein ACI4WX_13480 [Aristaeellaceae bacterium]
MGNASTTSPFMCYGTEEPWVTWTKQSSLMELIDEKQTERRSFSENKQMEVESRDTSVPSYPQPVPINRPQYNAILNRMNQAKNKTGAFTAWNTP